VALDGLLADVEAGCDLRVVQPFGDELEDFELPIRELLEDVGLGAPGAV
jgi:hypothetical protein